MSGNGGWQNKNWNLTSHVTWNPPANLYPDSQPCVRKTFSASFFSQPVENHTSQEHNIMFPVKTLSSSWLVVKVYNINYMKVLFSNFQIFVNTEWWLSCWFHFLFEHLLSELLSSVFLPLFECCVLPLTASTSCNSFSEPFPVFQLVQQYEWHL